MIEKHKTVWVAENAVLTGDITIGEGSSVWYGSVLRGDEAPITIGKNTNIQDGAILHEAAKYPLVIGDGVTVGHRAVLHGCEIGDNVVVGMGSIVMNGAKIGKNSIVGAGSLVTQNKEFPEGVLILGYPARVDFQLFRCSENCTSSSSTDSRSPIRPVFTDSSISMHFATLSLSLCTEKLFARFILRRTTKSRIPVL